MPTQVVDSNSNEIKVKTAYNGDVMITYIKEGISYDELCNEIRGICRFSPDQVSAFSHFFHFFFINKNDNFKFNNVKLRNKSPKRIRFQFKY